LQGNYYYQTDVPSLSVGPLGQVTFGTNDNYSVGLVGTYTLFNGGKDWKNADSFDLLAQGREKSFTAQEKQIELDVRIAYFKVQYGLRQLVLTSDSLKLSLSQEHDIDLRLKAGASSKLDLLQAQQDVTTYQLRYRQAQSDLAASLHNLFTLIGEKKTLDAFRPVPADLVSVIPKGVGQPTLIVKLDALDATLAKMSARKIENAGPRHPEIAALELQSAASRMAAEAEEANLWPSVQLQAKEIYEYPNVVLPQSTWQGIFAATVSFPLFEGGSSKNRASQKAAEAEATQYQREQRLMEMERDFGIAQDALASLKEQQEQSEANITQAKEVARLTYLAYQAGRSRYLDVQNANIKLLQAQVSKAQIDSEILSQLAVLNYLSAEGKE
jgi:outer membrane protein TolC